MRFLQYVGGKLGGLAIAGLLFGFFTLAFGLTPNEAMTELLKEVSEWAWLASGWFKLSCVIVGMGIIWVSIKYNIWSRRQIVIDELSGMLSNAIHDLMNRAVRNDVELGKFNSDFEHWCGEVVSKIDQNKAYFSKSDRIHFDRLGKVSKGKWGSAYRASDDDTRHDHLLNMLSLKFDRLRDIINWTQQRTR